jgi:hypothetical protein
LFENGIKIEVFMIINLLKLMNYAKKIYFGRKQMRYNNAKPAACNQVGCERKQYSDRRYWVFGA